MLLITNLSVVLRVAPFPVIRKKPAVTTIQYVDFWVGQPWIMLKDWMQSYSGVWRLKSMMNMTIA
jgi:hypothetical protein